MASPKEFYGLNLIFCYLERHAKIQTIGKPLLGEKYEEGKINKNKKKNNAKFSGHYVQQRTHNVRAHILRSDQLLYFVLNRIMY